MTEPDAWRQLDALRGRFLVEWELRSDLYVVANGGERHIMVNHERHNVSTVREYIEVLIAACEHVEGLNPEWSSNGACWAMRREGFGFWRCQFKAGHGGWHQSEVDGELVQWPSPTLTPIAQEKDDE